MAFEDAIRARFAQLPEQEIQEMFTVAEETPSRSFLLLSQPRLELVTCLMRRDMFSMEVRGGALFTEVWVGTRLQEFAVT